MVNIIVKYRKRESNPHGGLPQPTDFKSVASTYSAIPASLKNFYIINIRFLKLKNKIILTFIHDWNQENPWNYERGNKDYPTLVV